MFLLVLLIVVIVILFILCGNRHASMTQKASLYEQLGGIYPIAAVVDLFSDNLLKNPIVGVNSPNPHLRNWSRNQLDRLPGLKFMRTLWVADVSGGPYKFHASKLGKCPFSGKMGKDPLNLYKAHCNLHITSAEFDAVAEELAMALDHYKVPTNLKDQVLGAFAAHKNEVVTA